MATNKSIRITGTKELIAKMEAIKRTSPVALGAALYQEGQLIMNDSKENYVPVDTGTLKTSGHVRLPQITQNSITVTLGYGEAAQNYAVPVHENLKAKHTVGSAKYLETPVNNAIRTMAGRLAVKVNLFLKRFGK